MGISVLVDSISSFLNLSSSRHIDLDPFEKYYKRVEELLIVLKPIADAAAAAALITTTSHLVSEEEKIGKSFDELTQDVDHSIHLFRSWHAFSSKVYFVSSNYTPCDTCLDISVCFKCFLLLLVPHIINISMIKFLEALWLTDLLSTI